MRFEITIDIEELTSKWSEFSKLDEKFLENISQVFPQREFIDGELQKFYFIVNNKHKVFFFSSSKNKSIEVNGFRYEFIKYNGFSPLKAVKFPYIAVSTRSLLYYCSGNYLFPQKFTNWEKINYRFSYHNESEDYSESDDDDLSTSSGFLERESEDSLIFVKNLMNNGLFLSNDEKLYSTDHENKKFNKEADSVVFIERFGTKYFYVTKNGVVFRFKGGAINCFQDIFVVKISFGDCQSLVLSREGNIYLFKDFSTKPQKIMHDYSFKDILSSQSPERLIAIDSKNRKYIVDGQNLIYTPKDLKDLTNDLPEVIFIKSSEKPQKIVSNSLSSENDLRNSYEKIFNDKSHSNLTLIVENKEIFVYKDILKARSVYYEAMLNENKWKEYEQNVHEVKDFSYDVYLIFIRYLYTNLIDENINYANALELLKLSAVYCEGKLQRIIEENVKKCITVENVSSLYGTSYELNLNHLKQYCVEFFSKNFKKAMKSDAFRALNPEISQELSIKAVEDWN